MREYRVFPCMMWETGRHRPLACVMRVLLLQLDAARTLYVFVVVGVVVVAVVVVGGGAR